MEKLDLSAYARPSAQVYDPVAFGKLRADSYNQTEGDLPGPDCRKCRNKGTVARLKEDGTLIFAGCSCMPSRNSLRKMENSGLKNVIREMTFQQYRAEEPWQQGIKERAMAYGEEPQGWLLICGQIGSGKTHLCTAVCRELLLRQMEVRYMPWREEITRLKALSLDNDRRESLLRELKTAQVLYVDDLFKTGKNADGTGNPTSADIGIAYEILNYRYVNQLTTIISTEKLPEELLEIDEATASRILERARANILSVNRCPDRNYRLRGVVSV